MTNQEILKKAIEKANDNGYKLKFDDLFPAVVIPAEAVFDHDKTVSDLMTDILVNDHSTKVIFSHDFAKAFWCKDQNIRWEIHLQKMVIEEEPIKYLKRFL